MVWANGSTGIPVSTEFLSFLAAQIPSLAGLDAAEAGLPGIEVGTERELGDSLLRAAREKGLELSQEEQEHKNLLRLLMAGMDSCLTPIQRRRLWLSCVDGLTVRQISQTENANFQNVAKSIAAAKKNMKKILTE